MGYWVINVQILGVNCFVRAFKVLRLLGKPIEPIILFVDVFDGCCDHVQRFVIIFVLWLNFDWALLDRRKLLHRCRLVRYWGLPELDRALCHLAFCLHRL